MRAAFRTPRGAAAQGPGGEALRGRGDRSPPGRFRLSRRAGRAYQGALEAVLAIPIGMGLGYGADALFGSRPAGLLVGLGLGFAAFVIRVIRLRGLLEAEAARDAEAESEAQGRGSREGPRGRSEGGEGSASRWERR